MSDYNSNGNNRCDYCGGYNGIHDDSVHGYSSGRISGSGNLAVFLIFLILGIFTAALAPPLGWLLMLLGVKLSKI